MVQKEVGDRFKAKTNTKDYNSLTIYLNYYFDIKKILDVSKNVFIPKPKVDSIVLELKKKTNKLMIDDFQKNDNLEMFNYYNKTLKKNVLSFQKRESSQSSSVRSKIKNSLTIFQNKKSLKETIEPLQRKIYLFLLKNF